MHDKRLAGVADADALRFCVENDIDRHRKIGALIHVNVAVSGAGLDHGNRAVVYHRPDQSCSAARDQHIHVFIQLHKCGGRLAVGILNELNCIRRHIAGGKRVTDDLHNGDIRLQCVAAAL